MIRRFLAANCLRESCILANINKLDGFHLTGCVVFFFDYLRMFADNQC